MTQQACKAILRPQSRYKYLKGPLNDTHPTMSDFSFTANLYKLNRYYKHIL